MDEKKKGWQKPPLPLIKQECPHLGLFFASLSAHRYLEGTEWVCTCGKTFIVVSNGGRNKHLVPRGEYKP